VKWQIDPAIDRIVATWPTNFAPVLGPALGMRADQEFEAIIRQHIEDERPAGAHETLPSSGGKYVSHRLTIRCEDAEHVLRVYARLRAIDGVLTIL